MAELSDLEIIAARGELYRFIRNYFESSNVREVEVPLLAEHATTDPQLISFYAKGNSGSAFLQTSPEFFLKRLLARFPYSVFSITKAFRDEESGRRHNPEFSMLEWYQMGFRLEQIIEDCVKLIKGCLATGDTAVQCQKIIETPVIYETYQSLFAKHLHINPHQTNLAELQSLVEAHTSYQGQCDSVDEALQLLLSTVIEPRFGAGISVLSDFPVSQAALAEIELDDNGQQVAKRFELYIGDMEIANGYQELCDADELARRFAEDNKKRAAANKPEIAPDLALLDALKSGLPACSGVSIGLDRLLMAKVGAKDIRSVMLFPWHH